MGVLSVREPAIRQPRAGDSAWEDGGTAVLNLGSAVLRAGEFIRRDRSRPGF